MFPSHSCAAGSFLGSLSTVKSHQLGSLVIKEVLARAGVDPSEVSEVIMGQVSRAVTFGVTVRRQTAVSAGGGTSSVVNAGTYVGLVRGHYDSG